MMQHQTYFAAVCRTVFVLAVIVSGTTVWPPRAVAVDVVAVCPSEYREAFQPWVDFRRSEGLSVRVCEVKADPAQQQAEVAAAANDETRYVLLVGAAPVIGRECQAGEVPTLYVPSRVTVAWGSTPTLATDFPYGDFDGDGRPEAAVGRLPVRSSKQLEGVVSRILAYEQSDDFGAWRGQVQLTGGIGGFGALADAAIETVSRTVLTSMLPAETRATVAYASPGHRFFPAGDSFTDAVLHRYREGARFWVYAGHGWVNQLDRVPGTAEGVPVLDGDSVRRLQREASGAPIALMLACYTGAIDAAEPCLAQQMLLADGGPIAVFAGSRVTMPYGNAAAAVGLIDGVYGQQQPRIGDAWLSTLEQMNQEDDTIEKSAARLLIDTLAAFFTPGGMTLADERREHMRLYHLIGDPTLRLHHPEPLQMEVDQAEDKTQNHPLRLRMTSPIAGALTVCVDVPLGASTEGDPNQTTVAQVCLDVTPDEAFEPSIMLPKNLRGPVIIRALVTGQRAWATAAKTLHLR